MNKGANQANDNSLDQSGYKSTGSDTKPHATPSTHFSMVRKKRQMALQRKSCLRSIVLPARQSHDHQISEGQ
jgi:hypothetical protein